MGPPTFEILVYKSPYCPALLPVYSILLVFCVILRAHFFLITLNTTSFGVPYQWFAWKRTMFTYCAFSFALIRRSTPGCTWPLFLCVAPVTILQVPGVVVEPSDFTATQTKIQMIPVCVCIHWFFCRNLVQRRATCKICYNLSLGTSGWKATAIGFVYSTTVHDPL